MKIAIFGGSFDPIHLGHVEIVKEALNKLDIDKLVIVPTYLNPFKDDFKINPEIRYKLLDKVFFNYKKIEICDYEIKQNKSVYSIETVEYLKQRYSTSKIYFIIGQDNLKTLDRWYKIEELKSLVEFVVATRNGYNKEEIKNYKTLDINVNISSTQLRAKLDLTYLPKEIQEDILNLKK